MQKPVRHTAVLLSLLTAALVGCGGSTTPSGTAETLSGTVVVIGTTRYDFNANVSTPDAAAAAGAFVRQPGTAVMATDPFAGRRETCAVTSGAATVSAALDLPLPTGTPVEAGAALGLQSGTAPYGTLTRTAAGQYAPASPLPQTVPATLQLSVPGAAGGFPASSDSVSTLAPATLRPSGFSVSTPPTGSQADLTGDLLLTWTPGAVPAVGTSSAVILEFAGVDRRSDRVTCLANDDGSFLFRATDPAYVNLARTNTRLRFEGSARAVGRVKAAGTNAFLTTILVDRTLATAP